MPLFACEAPKICTLLSKLLGHSIEMFTCRLIAYEAGPTPCLAYCFTFGKDNILQKQAETRHESISEHDLAPQHLERKSKLVSLSWD
jgi:hypothetical protein